MACELELHIDQIVYSNEDSGYTVARGTASRSGEQVTVVGTLVLARPGDSIRARGDWTTHPRFGRQFRISDYQTLVPTTAAGVERYLGSGVIPGIGPVMAKRIVERFGTDALDVIGNAPERLAEVEGIGSARIDMIRGTWQEQREVRDVMIFLQSHGVGPGYAARIFKRYGRAAVQVVRENPYRLATEISGIGFVIADRIAEQLGIDRCSSQRVRAGLVYVLERLCDEGHCYCPEPELVRRCSDMLGVSGEQVEQALRNAGREKAVVLDVPSGGRREAEGRAVYLPLLYSYERGIAEKLLLLSTSGKQMKGLSIAGALKRAQNRLSITLASGQAEAVRLALEKKVLVITGGPGTGKTTIINAVLQAGAGMSGGALLAAPTGRAAKRMSETTGREAMTLHRLLRYNPRSGEFEKNAHSPLQCELLILDEVSMIDACLMFHLLQAVPRQATLVMVGDVNQLPSVGPGAVLRDIIDSGSVPVVELTEIFRQARESRIITNAHRINSGEMPDLSSSRENPGDFYFIERENPEDALAMVVELVGSRMPARFGLDPVHDIQVITPMHKGAAGTENLNAALQDALNADAQAISGTRSIRLYDKVMQVKNNYDREVFNGDIGIVRSVDPKASRIVVEFESRGVAYDAADLDELTLAYAVSVHKAQGSEFPAVIMPVLTQHYVMLQRNLIYTAVTRGKRIVVLVGTKKALSIGVRTSRSDRRYSRLQDLLCANKRALRA